MLHLTQDESELKEAILKAGEALLSYFPGSNARVSNLGIQQKGDGSFVTKADFASNEIILSALSRLYPEDSVLTEEIPAGVNLRDKSRIWIVDPLDGTQSFLDGNDDFSILVSLVIDGTAQTGFMNFPARGEFITAKRGSGAYCNSTKLSVSQSSKLRNESVYIRNFIPTDESRAFKPWMDSGCAFHALAKGQFDGLIIKLVSHREWDLAAPSVAVEESGGRTSDEHGNQVLLSPGKLTCKYFVASNGKCHDELLSLIPQEDK